MRPSLVDKLVDLAYGILILVAVVMMLSVGGQTGTAFGLGILFSYGIHVVWKMARYDPEWMTTVVEQTVQGSVEETVEQAVEESVEESVEETVEQAVEETVEESVEETVEETVEESVEETVEETVEESVEDSVEQAVEETLPDAIEQKDGRKGNSE